MRAAPGDVSHIARWFVGRYPSCATNHCSYPFLELPGPPWAIGSSRLARDQVTGRPAEQAGSEAVKPLEPFGRSVAAFLFATGFLRMKAKCRSPSFGPCMHEDITKVCVANITCRHGDFEPRQRGSNIVP